MQEGVENDCLAGLVRGARKAVENLPCHSGTEPSKSSRAPAGSVVLGDQPLATSPGPLQESTHKASGVIVLLTTSTPGQGENDPLFSTTFKVSCRSPVAHNENNAK